MLLYFSIISFGQSTTATNAQNPPQNRFLGFTNNFPLFTQTNGIVRTRLNHNFTTTVNGVNKQFNGYFGISPLGFFNNNTPYAMLHLYGQDNSGFNAGAGWRQWMETGLLMNENSDGMYVGLKQEIGTNRSDAIVNWSDDPNGSSGPDKLRFIHTGANLGNGGTQTDPRDPFSLDGYEYMRMTAQGAVNALGYASGHIGIGPLFTTANFPQARVHMHSEDDLTNYIQISINASTGIGATDGTRLGVLGAQNNLAEEGNALLYNQEQDRHLLFSTGYATPTNIANTRERVRLTSYDAPTTLPNGIYGNYIPDAANVPVNTDITRMSISHNPLQPVTRPLSLLHLGYNTGAVSFLPGPTDGWRAWMDIGMFTSNGTDNVYIGLKKEKASVTNPTDRHDAIINWGDNQASGPTFAGPDHMRFVFTATQTGIPTTAPANGFDGLEAMRMTPTLNTGVLSGIGGDPSFNQYFGGSDSPTNTLEVNSWGLVSDPGGSSGLRFTDLNTNSPTITNPGPGVLAVNDNGDVIYVPGGGLGNYCGLPKNSLTADYEIDMDDKNLFFRRGGTMFIGDVNCGQTQNARVFLRNSFFPTYTKPIALQVESSHASGNNFAGFFQAQNSGSFNVALFGRCVPVNPTAPTYPPSPTTGNFAGYFDGDTYVSGRVYVTQVGLVISDQNIKTDIDSLTDALSLIDQLKPRSFYYDSTAIPDMQMSEEKQYGFIAQDVEMILPELVSQQYSVAKFDSLGNVTNTPQLIKNLNYNSFIAILTKGIQELKSENAILKTDLNSQDSINNSLQEQINTLYSMITSCCNNNSNTENNAIQQNPTLDVTLSDNVSSIVLDQNVPNPFAEQTTITYTLTEGVKKAQMLFYHIEGKLIQATELSNTSGQGQMNVFANDLSTGVYTYTLVVDGEIKGTKRMVKE